MEGSLRKLVTRNSWSDRIDVEDETVDSVIRVFGEEENRMNSRDLQRGTVVEREWRVSGIMASFREQRLLLSAKWWEERVKGEQLRNAASHHN